MIEAEAVADEAGDTVVGIGAGIDAGIAARTFLQVQDQKALRFHQPLRKELVDGNAVDRLHALLVGHLAFGGYRFESDPDGREAFNHLAEIVAGDADDFDMVESRARGGTNAAAEEPDFAEVVAARKIGEDQLTAGIIFRDFYETDADKVEAISGVALAGDALAGCETLKLDAFFEVFDKVGGKVCEHGDAAQMIFQSSAAIVGIDLRAEGFVLEHDVENVAQHFVSDDIGFRMNRGGARIKIHAGHFTKEVAGAEFCDRMAVGKVDGSVDGDGAVARFAFAFVLFPGNERAGETFEETLGAAIRFYMSDRCGDGNFGLALKNVERGGTEFAFPADDIAFAETAFDDGPAIQLKEGAGNPFEHRDLQEFFGFETFGAGTSGNGCTDYAFVGERAGGAGNHTLAAGDAGGIAHGRIEIERDASGIAFAHAAEYEIVFDFIATADAAVAKDAGVMIDVDGERRIVLTACNGALGEAWFFDAGVSCVGLQFAIPGVYLTSTGGGMIGHQKFQDGFAGAQNFFGIGRYFHARFDGPNARGGENTSAGVDDAEAADSHGSFVLQMAERGNRDAVDACGIENGSAGGDPDGLAVYGDFDKRRSCGGRAHYFSAISNRNKVQNKLKTPYGRMLARLASPARAAGVKQMPLGHLPCNT